MTDGPKVSASGFVNAHTHLYSGLVPLGMPEPEPAPTSFPEILERVWWRLDRALDEETLRASAEHYLAHAVEHDTLALVDHHESPAFIEGSLDVLADACQGLSLPAVLTYGATERNGGRDEARRGLAECRRFIETNERPLVRGVVGLHAPFTVSDETLREAADLARELDTVLHVHVAEDEVDVEHARSLGYAGVVDRLVRNDALGPGWILAHGIWLEPDEVRTLAEAGCWLVQNPRSNRGNRVGYPSSLVVASDVALGTDGYPSDMRDEQGALIAEAAAQGDDIERASKRLSSGERMIRRWFDAEQLSSARAEARERVAAEREGIAERARGAALRLWARIRAL